MPRRRAYAAHQPARRADRPAHRQLHAAARATRHVLGPDFDPAHPDDRERGLLGNFIGASLGAQFEAVMCDWLNLGLQNPDVTGANDPLIGANTPETSWLDLSLKNGGRIRLRGFPRFVTTRGGAYTRVFDSEEDAMRAVMSKSMRVGDVVVIRYEGPCGGRNPGRDRDTVGEGLGDWWRSLTAASAARPMA